MYRRPIRTATLTLGLVAVLAGNGGPVQGAEMPDAVHDQVEPVASASSGCDATGWRSLVLPGSKGSIGMDVATTAGRVRWVVGMRAGAGTPRRPWIVKRIDGGWRAMTTPNVGSDAGLVAVDARSPKSAWAVGFRAVSRYLKPVAMVWNGSRWSAASPPSGSSSSLALTDVSVGKQIWTVGYHVTATGPRPYAAQRKNGRWIRHDPLLASGSFGALTAVAGNTSTGIWAAGWQSDRTGIRPLLVQRVNGKWKKARLSGASLPDAVLTGLVTQGSQMWAVGFRDDGVRQVPLLFRGDAGGWTRQKADAFAGSTQPDDVVIKDGRPVIAGGGRQQDLGRMFHMVASLDDGQLHMTRRPASTTGQSYLRAIARDGKRLFAVGWTNGRPITIASCHEASSPTSASFSFSASETLVGGPDVVSESAAIVGEADRPMIDPAADSPSGSDADSTDNVAAVRVRFRNVARKAGVSGTSKTYGATVLDLDGDGWDDLLISRHTGKARVLSNRQGVFKGAPSTPLPGKDRHGCAAGDFDADGQDEAYCAVGAARGVKFKSNELLMDLTSRAQGNDAGRGGGVEPFGRGRRATVLNLNNDGRPDLLVSSDPLRVDGLPALNRAYRNQGAAGFTGAMEFGLDLPIGGLCALSAQLDGEGRGEVVLCTDEPWHGARGLHIFRYRDGRFREATKALGVKPLGSIDAVSADFDGDGKRDLAQLSRTQLVVSLQRNGVLRRSFSMSVRHGRAIAAGHVNGDDKADLYVMQGGPGNAPDKLLINTASGRAFRAAPIPQTRSGDADDVVTIDHDRNGLDDFLVLNGFLRAGPTLLIAAYRT